MNTQEENSIDQLLRQLKPMAAPKGFEDEIMLQVRALQQKPETVLLPKLHHYLLGVSLVAIVVAAFYIMGFEQVQPFLSSVHFFSLKWLHSDLYVFSSMINSFSKIPVLILLSAGILTVLLIFERILVRKSKQPMFVFMF